MGGSRGCFAALVACGSLALARPALAQSAARAPDAQLEYRVPEACPDREAWLAQVMQRTGSRSRERVGAELAELLRAIVVSPAGESARISFRAGMERLVSGRDCAEVVSAAALISALALGVVAEPTSEPDPGAPPALPVPAATPAALPAPAPAVLPPGAPLSDRGTKAAAGSARSWGLGLGGGASTNTWLGPGLPTLFDGVLDVLLPSPRWSARLRASWGRSAATVAERRAEFHFVGGALDVCPLGLGEHLDWQWTSCIGLQLGALRAAGDAESALAQARRRSSLWGGAELTTRAQTPRVAGLRLEAEAGLSAPFWQREFRFSDPDALVFDPPRLGLSGRLGLLIPLER